MDNNIKQKIDELIEIAHENNDPSTESILLALKGAKKIGQDKKLAIKVGEYIKDVLKPEVERIIRERKASRN